MMIDEDGIVVSATEPTGGSRRKVWMQKGKNIIPTDFNNWESGQYNMDDGQVEYNPARIRLNSLLKVKQGKTYYFNIFSDYMFVIRTYDKNGNFSRSIGGIENGSTITTNTDEQYLGVTIYSASSAPTFEDYKALFENGTIKPMICLNSEKNKEFEPNIKNAVHVKNDNGEYEEFMKKEETEWKTAVNYNTSTENWRNSIKYKRVENEVQVQGSNCYPSTALTVDAFGTLKLGTLEPGFRPKEAIVFSIFAKNIGDAAITNLVLSIRSDGEIYLYNPTGQKVSNVSYFTFYISYFLS